MQHFKENIFYFIICLTLSLMNYFSFRIHFYEGNYFIYLSFISFQAIIWLSFIFCRKLNTTADVLMILIFINTISTPLYFVFTKDVPVLKKNLKYSIEHTEDGFFGGMFDGKQEIFTDEKGFRTNKKKINYKTKNQGTLRIFVIGASAAANMELGNMKNWSSVTGKLLEKSLNRNVEVINTAINGLRSVQFYLKLRDIAKYEPDLIIIMTGINDWNQHIIKNYKFIFPNFEINFDIEKSLLFNTFRNIKKTIIRKIRGNKKILKKLKNENKLIIVRDGEAVKIQTGSLYKEDKRVFNPDDVSQNYKFWINKIIDYCEKNQIDFDCLFLDQPNSYNKSISKNLMDRLWGTPPNVDYTLTFDSIINISNLYNKWIKKRVAESNLFIFSISEKIPKNLKYLRDDVHYTELGSNLIANELHKFIIGNFDY